MMRKYSYLLKEAKQMQANMNILLRLKPQSFYIQVFTFFGKRNQKLKLIIMSDSLQKNQEDLKEKRRKLKEFKALQELILENLYNKK